MRNIKQKCINFVIDKLYPAHLLYTLIMDLFNKEELLLSGLINMVVVSILEASEFFCELWRESFFLACLILC